MSYTAVNLDRVPGRKLSQKRLRAIFAAQQRGDWLPTQESQLGLRKTFLRGVQARWRQFMSGHPDFKSIGLDISNPEAHSALIDSDLIDTNNISTHMKTFEKMAPKSTAGIRHLLNILAFGDPNVMYNRTFTAMLIEAEATFTKTLHQDIHNYLASKDLAQLASEVRKKLDPATVKAVEEIFQMSLEEILPFLKDNPVKVIGREVRPHTDEMLEMEARILAANGITTITTEQFTDTMTIYLNSFLCFLLGSSGGTFYTPSHSEVYILGRKALGRRGDQLLPDVYATYIQILQGIYQKAMEEGYSIKMTERDDQHIKRTLNPQNLALLYSNLMNPKKSVIDEINQAVADGLRINLNCLNGSTWRTVKAQLAAYGIERNIFNLMYGEEDQFFRIGYMVTQDKDTGMFMVDQLGEDTTSPKVVRTIPYAQELKDAEVGRYVFECDPDSDRFVVKQVLSVDSIPLLEEYGIDYYRIGTGTTGVDRVLAAPSPNKVFLLLDIADYERMKTTGEWEQRHFLYFPTYVSSKAWVEFAEYLEEKEQNITTFLCRVGFKNFNGIEAEIIKWYYESEEPELLIADQLGKIKRLVRTDKGFRILSKEEESGGRVAGQPEPIYNILGQVTWSMPEKSAGDAMLAMLYDIARRYNQGMETHLDKIIDAAYKKYNLRSKIDVRYDILHGNQGVIAQKPPAEQNRLLALAGAEKSNFNNFFFSIGQAIRDNQLSIEKAREILKIAIPQWSDTWDCLVEATLVNEPLAGGASRPEGVPMIFSAQNGKTPMVTAFKFRPSGTDLLKSKVYVDAEVLTPAQRTEIEQVFDALKRKDLYALLDRFGIAYAEEKPAEVAEINLQPIEN